MEMFFMWLMIAIFALIFFGYMLYMEYDRDNHFKILDKKTKQMLRSRSKMYVSRSKHIRPTTDIPRNVIINKMIVAEKFVKKTRKK